MRTRIAVTAIAASLVLLGGIFVVATPALANQYSGTMPSNTMASSNMTLGGNASGTMTSGFDHNMMSWFNTTGKTFGLLSSIQNDENGEPAWMITGHWMITNDTGASNETAGTNVTDLHAGFQMIRLDGSAGHMHEIYNFTQEDSTTQGNLTTITGKSTVTMREGPVEDVGTDIKISGGKVIAITLDPQATENHFGDTPIYGMVITPEIMQHIMNTTSMSAMGSMLGGCDKMMGNTTTAMTGEMWK